MESNHVIFAVIILILACIWWFMYHRTEADLAIAREAVKAVITKQQIDINSFNIRTELQLTKLEQVRQLHAASNSGYSAFLGTLKSVHGWEEVAYLDSETEIVAGNAYSKVAESQRQLESCTNMVRAFHESIVFFKRKWKGQLEEVIAQYPITVTHPEETYLAQLIEMPDSFSDASEKLRVALHIA